MKKLAMIAAISFLIASCGENYSNGDRRVTITEFSKKGILFSSYEGSSRTGFMPQAGGPSESFNFSLPSDASPDLVKKIEAALRSGKEVTIRYRQWCVAPPSIDSTYVITDVIE